nr:immunoglobulin heavy chain junction region [Mus musculus]NSM04301.1 immunoglobulin heavy chain junction region [Mus musculus]NSM06350.1 immunoglobulin heavy chain junction region [Mus musculus]NSM06375.1 immunoglobulin heavy chain junction region [Mus musculus]NSM08419.1 immunoglobulin heavy chain junction region [Mus musculus]
CAILDSYWYFDVW